jgi:hypothetical protein
MADLRTNLEGLKAQVRCHAWLSVPENVVGLHSVIPLIDDEVLANPQTDILVTYLEIIDGLLRSSCSCSILNVLFMSCQTANQAQFCKSRPTIPAD